MFIIAFKLKAGYNENVSNLKLENLGAFRFDRVVVS